MSVVLRPNLKCPVLTAHCRSWVVGTLPTAEESLLGLRTRYHESLKSLTVQGFCTRGTLAI